MPHGHEHQPTDEERSGSEAVGEPAEAGRKNEQYHGRRKEEQPGLERCVTDHRLKVETEVERRACERSVDDERLDVDEGEVTVAKQAKRQQRLPCPPLTEDEGREAATPTANAHATSRNPCPPACTSP